MDLKKKVNLKLSDSAARYGSLSLESPGLKKRKSKTAVFMLIFAVGLVGLGCTGIYYGRTLSKRELEVTYAVPGITALQSGYNMLSGMSLDDAKNVARFQYVPADKQKPDDVIKLGATTYTIPKGVRVNVHVTCSTRSISEGLLETSSFSDMKSSSDDMTFGYDAASSVEVALPVPGVDATASKDVRNALVFGNSEGFMESRHQARKGFNYRETKSNRAKVFVAYVDWNEKDMTFEPQFIKDFNEVAQASDAAEGNVRTFRFFSKYGSHLVSKAYFGAKCERSLFMNAGHTESSEANARTTAKGLEVQLFDFKFGKSTTETVASKTDSSTGVMYKEMNLKCDGSVSVNKCDESFADEDMYPHPLEIQPIGMWELTGPSFSEQAKNVMTKAVEDLVVHAQMCSSRQCNDKGVCVLDPDFMKSTVKSDKFQGTIFPSDFLPDCVCKTGGRPRCLDNTIYIYDVNGNRNCADVCSSKGKDAIMTQSQSQGDHLYFCDADMGDGYRGGYNTLMNGCGVAVSTYQEKHNYRCYCTRELIYFKPSHRENCNVVCDRYSLDPVQTGVKKNGMEGVFYACEADGRGSWNAASAIPGRCVGRDGYSTRERRFEEFRCLCVRR